MPRGSEELTIARRIEIINACASLYERMTFDEISLKDISKVTSLSRPSIYNYFQTKEEIFMALFQQEYELWNHDLQMILDKNTYLTHAEFADKIAQTLSARPRLIKLLSMNLLDMEIKSRFEALVEFKKSFVKPIRAITALLRKFFPQMSEQEIESFRFVFFPYIFGVYPYSVLTDPQKHALQLAGITYAPRSVYQLLYDFILKQLVPYPEHSSDID